MDGVQRWGGRWVGGTKPTLRGFHRAVSPPPPTFTIYFLSFLSGVVFIKGRRIANPPNAPLSISQNLRVAQVLGGGEGSRAISPPGVCGGRGGLISRGNKWDGTAVLIWALGGRNYSSAAYVCGYVSVYLCVCVRARARVRARISIYLVFVPS